MCVCITWQVDSKVYVKMQSQGYLWSSWRKKMVGGVALADIKTYEALIIKDIAGINKLTS